MSVAAAGSFTRAADMLNVSQPAVTKTIQDLETAIGADLFERLPRGILLTEAGRIMQRRGQTILAELTHASHEISSLSESGTPRLAIGTAPIGAASFIPLATTAFLENHPHTHLTIRDGSNADLLPLLRTGDLDFVFSPIPDEPPSDLTMEVMMEDGFSIIARAGHPLDRSAAASVDDLRPYGWILPPQGLAPRRLFDAVLRRAGFEPPQAGIETLATSTIRTLLMKSDRIAMLPRSVVQTDVTVGLLAVLPVILSGSNRPIGTIRRAGSSVSPHAEVFLAALRDQIAASTS